MIISGGFNVYPCEVEQVIYGFPEVFEVAVVGVPDAQWGRAVHSTFQPADPVVFANGNLGPGRPGYGYRNYWYQKNDGDGSVEASGRFGQTIYINPRREVVIVKLSATADQARRATRADGEVKAPVRVVDSPAAFNSMVGAVLAALPG
ncbi:hypothetical protein PPUJ20005_47670 [Pseudomonas putida]|jgi:CubicO group peptidase (beta-lactamase class C family)|nr:hypothetical protein PPUJ20005_47670 [Pseudomonas putida]